MLCNGVFMKLNILATAENIIKIYFPFSCLCPVSTTHISTCLSPVYHISGNIAGVTGVQKTITGDTLLNNASAMKKFDEADIALPSLTIPEPVFMCSVEPYSTKDQKKLDVALKCLIREDPSLRYSSALLFYKNCYKNRCPYIKLLKKLLQL